MSVAIEDTGPDQVDLPSEARPAKPGEYECGHPACTAWVIRYAGEWLHTQGPQGHRAVEPVQPVAPVAACATCGLRIREVGGLWFHVWTVGVVIGAHVPEPAVRHG